MFRCYRAVLLAIVAAMPALAAASPSIFWASDPVRPGEAVVVVGDGLAGARVSIGRFPDTPNTGPGDRTEAPADTRQVTPIQPSDGSVKCAIPADAKPGLYALRLETATGATTAALNRPVVWWTQGEGTVAVAPGALLRLFGKNLANSGGLPVTALLRGPKSARLAAEGDGFAIQVKLPADLPEGDYTVLVHNGWGGAAGWSAPVAVTVKRPALWPSRVYNIHDFGADGQGQADDSPAVKAALGEIAKAGGGVLYFPRGRYRLSQTIELPRRTVLRGEGRELVSIFWPEVQDALPAQIKGTNSFGIEGITFYCSNYSRFITADSAQPDAGDIRLRRVTVRANRYRGHMTPEEADRRMRTGGDNQCPLLSFGGANVEVTDCDLYSSGMVFWLSRLRGALIARNTLTNGRLGWYCLSGNDGVIFEHNRILGGDLMATGGGLNTLDGSTYSQHVYYAHNTLANMFGWDREAMTSDAGGGAYFGKVATAAGNVVTLAEDPKLGGRDWKGAGLYVLDGKGAGQYRRVVSATGRDVTVDSPWQVPPDTTSTVTFCAFQGRCLFIDNDFTDAGIALQLYGNAIEHILAGNRSTRTAGFHNFGMMYDNGIQPNWYLQWLDNRILEGNVYRGDHDNSRESGEAHIGVYAFPPRADWDCPLTLGTIIRRSRLDNNAHIMLGCEYNGGFERKGRYVRDVLVENNHIANSDLGVFAYATADGVVLRGNGFSNVRSPLGGPGMSKAFVTSAERAEALRVGLQSLVDDLGVKDDVGKWPEVMAAVEALRKLPDGSPDVPKLQAQGLRSILVRVAKARPEGLAFTAVAPALGLSMRMPWECTAHTRLQDHPEGGPASLDLIISATTPLGEPVSLTGEVQAPEGWQTKPSQPVDLDDKSPVTVSIPISIPPGEWASHDFPVTLDLDLGTQTLRLHATQSAGSGYIRKWMVLGPFPNRTGAALDMTLLPPDDGIDLGGEYDGVNGKIKWQPREGGDWIDFKDLYKLPKAGVAYIAACINSPRDMPAELRLGCSGGASLTVNGEPVWFSDRSHPAGPAQERAPIRLKAGDNVILLKLCSIIDQWTVVCELAPAPGGQPLTGVTVVSPTQFRDRACFAPPKRTVPEVGEIRYPAGVDWKLVYADDFGNDALGGRWRVGSGKWKVNGSLLQASDVAFLCYAEKLPAPVRIEYDTRVPGQVGGDLSACWLADPGNFNLGYLIGFGSNGNTLNKIVLDGEQVAQAISPVVTPGRWHHVIAQILASGRVQLIVDGVLSLDYPGKAPGEPKYPGIWSWQSNGVFAKVRIFSGVQ